MSQIIEDYFYLPFFLLIILWILLNIYATNDMKKKYEENTAQLNKDENIRYSIWRKFSRKYICSFS